MGRSQWELPPRTCVQGRASKTFIPPQRSSLTLPDVFDWHYSRSPKHPLFVHSVNEESDEGVRQISWRDAVKGVYRVAHNLRNTVGSSSKAQVIGLYSSADPFTYLLVFMGILRAGYTVFLMSPHASQAALSHLILTSGVTQILVGDNTSDTMDRLHASIADARKKQLKDVPKVTHHLNWSELLEEGDVETPARTYHLNDPCIIIHSSGSTSLPKLNYWTHKMMIIALWQPWYGERDICGEIMSTASIPMSGGGGLIQLLLAASSGLIISGFKPASPAVAVNSRNVWRSMLATNSTMGFVRQPILQAWSEEPEKCSALAKLTCVCFGIGPLDKTVGDKLANAGVNLVSFFGSSECAVMNTIFPKSTGLEWEYFSLYKLASPTFIPQGTDGLVELIMKTSEFHSPARIDTECDGIPAFATGDLLQAHPTKTGFWKYAGRKDDQEILPSGMKINAVVFEKILMEDPHIAGAVIFSRGARFGVIVEPTKHLNPEAFKVLIWPTIERYNIVAPEPARLLKEIIIVASQSKPFLYGEKGHPRRKEAIAVYSSEIESL